MAGHCHAIVTIGIGVITGCIGAIVGWHSFNYRNGIYEHWVINIINNIIAGLIAITSYVGIAIGMVGQSLIGYYWLVLIRH